MIDEEAELGLIARPKRRPVKGEGEENHIDPGRKRGFGKAGAGQETGDDNQLEDGRELVEACNAWRSG